MTRWYGTRSRAWAGATPSPVWSGGYGGYGAFGLLVPTPLPGNPGYAPDMKATGYNYCGSKFGMQQMLQDLGYYNGMIDGDIGTGTITAMKHFGNDHGVPISGSLSNAWCQKLMEAWQAKMQRSAPGPAPAPDPSPASPGPSPSNGASVATAPPNGGQTTQNGTTNGGAIASTTNGLGPIDKAKLWWNSQSTGTKAAIGLGAVAVVGLIVYAAVGGKKKATPNQGRSVYLPNRKRSLTSKQKAALKRIRGKRAEAKTGKITTLKSGKRYGHLKPPKRYYQKGARRPSDYADPKHYKYPLVFRTKSGKVKPKETKKHIRAAQSYFARHKRKYSPSIRKTIASNINKAKSRYGVGGKTVKA